MNKVLVIGSGGREHAIAWRMTQSKTVSQVFVAPGNAGTQNEARMDNIDLDIKDFDAVIKFCQLEQIDLVVVGPEQPLVEGMVDALTAKNIACFGPTAAAAQLEGSKAFTKRFLEKYDIPTAQYKVFTDSDLASEYLRTHQYPVVIKADGLAAGKGVVIAQDFDEAHSAVKDMLSDNRFGSAGSRIVIEDFLRGEEASFIVIADGNDFVSLASSQDHKARDDGDVGPNTGGMGAYSPAPIVTDTVHQRIVDQVIKPTLAGMQSEGMPFTGFLYAGLMIDDDGHVKVLEFNVRCGDPETQPIMLRLTSQLDQLCLAAIEGRLSEQEVMWDTRFALGVVLAEKGYPNTYTTGQRIASIHADKQADNCKIFHAGTAINEGQVVSSGGRVVCVCALHEELQQAQLQAYHMVDQVKWNSAYWRTDIGAKGIRRIKSNLS